MAQQSNISWTDGTLNFWEGCTRVSEGCRHCYAETRDRRHHAGVHWGAGAPRRKSLSAMTDIVRMNKRAADGKFVVCQCGGRHWAGAECCELITGKTLARPVMFVMSLGDIFDEEVPIEWLAEALVAILKADSMDFMILTKRIESALARVQAATAVMTPAWRERVLAWTEGTDIPTNVAIGQTIESDFRASYRMVALVNFPAVRRFISAEPCLNIGWLEYLQFTKGAVQQVIVGGESGTQARPMNPAWPLAVERECDFLGIPFHFKQWGEWVPSYVQPVPANINPGNMLAIRDDGSIATAQDAIQPGDAVVWRAGKKKAGFALDREDGRTRTELLTFPGLAWRRHWFKLTDHPLGDRFFPSQRSLQEFLAVNPGGKVKVADWLEATREKAPF